MRKYFLITLILCIYQFSGYTQNANTLWIDSLKRKLPSLTDSAKVDCLNQLADAFRTNGPNVALDSIYKYSIAANKEALKIGYKKGEAFSLLNLGADGIKQAVSIGENINNPKILGRSSLDSSYRASSNDSYRKILMKALTYFEQANDIEGKLETNIRLCDAYTSSGRYEEGFKYCDKCILLKNQATLTPWGHEMVLWYFQHMAGLYERSGDYETALDYCHQGNYYSAKYKLTWNLDLELVNVLTQLGKYDSAFYYLNNFEKEANNYILKNRPYWVTSLGQLYLKSKQYDKALAISKEGITYFKNQNSKSSALARHLLCAANASFEIKRYTAALTYAKEGIALAEKNDLFQSMMNSYKLIAEIYHHFGNNTNAYLYLQKHLVLKDSILNSQFYFRLYNYKKEAEVERKISQLNLFKKDNQLKQQQLKQEATLRNSLITGLILLLLLGIYIIRNLNLKRKTSLEKQRLENEKKQAELEMQALRAQMNPHFIFNCLSSINRFILKNEGKTASNYLTRFSRLMRMVLMNSQKPLISLDDELQMLEIYLEMERLRFKNSFDYAITFLNTVDSDNVFIPPLLLQPFCENAIWHGLMHKEGQGRLDIELSMSQGTPSEEDKILICTITDNGVGREKAEEMNSKTAEKEKSMGLKITTERLALLNKEKGLQTFYEIEDLKDEKGDANGTKVILKISFKELIEKVV
jgi:tetratricopeptide (TPR) repeat protein